MVNGEQFQLVNGRKSADPVLEDKLMSQRVMISVCVDHLRGKKRSS
jgi:hypothetical protein